MAEPNEAALPAVAREMLPPADMPLALRLWFDDPLFQRVKLMATYLSKAEGITPQHLLGKTEACFFVVEKALGWNLSPSAVGAATYMTPGGRIGFEGKLCHAIIEQSQRLAPGSGGVRYEHFGPWENVAGKFEIITSQKSGKDFAKATWTRKDTKGIGVIVRARLKGEQEDRELTFLLEQAFPLNSTLWATDPRTQICYLAVRRFASVVAPGLIMGVPFDNTEPLEDNEVGRAARARDVTPRAPTRADFESVAPAARREAEPASEEGPATQAASGPESSVGPSGDQPGASGPVAQSLTVTDCPDGTVIYEGEDPTMFSSHLMNRAAALAKAKDWKVLDALWEENSPEFAKLPKAIADGIRETWPKPAGKLV